MKGSWVMSWSHRVVFCPVRSESAAERFFPVEHHHQHKDHQTERYTRHWGGGGGGETAHCYCFKKGTDGAVTQQAACYSIYRQQGKMENMSTCMCLWSVSVMMYFKVSVFQFCIIFVHRYLRMCVFWQVNYDGTKCQIIYPYINKSGQIIQRWSTVWFISLASKQSSTIAKSINRTIHWTPEGKADVSKWIKTQWKLEEFVIVSINGLCT